MRLLGKSNTAVVP